MSYEKLTFSQKFILDYLMTYGFANAADMLGMKPSTFRSHIRNMADRYQIDGKIFKPSGRLIYLRAKELGLISCLLLSSCASMRRHPVVYGLAIGAAAGTTIALATRHNCPSTYDGKPYEGTPPCPK